MIDIQQNSHLNDTIQQFIIDSRISRPVQKFNRISRLDERETRHHSLISLRTFFAFGARSASVSSASTHRPYAVSPSQKQSAYQATNSLSRSSEQSTACSFSSHNSVRFINKANNDRFSLFHKPSASSTTKQNQLSKRYSSVNNSISLPTTATQFISDDTVWNRRRKRSLVVPLISSTHDSSFNRDGHINPKANQATNPHLSGSSSISSETTARKGKLNEEGVADLNSLRTQNELLLAEVQRLMSLLREKEQNEREFKRRILESEAETKLWKKKYEMQKPPVIEMRENDADVSTELIDQLDSAAEKLSRLNAVNDLKLLQTEMETALNEIRRK